MNRDAFWANIFKCRAKTDDYEIILQNNILFKDLKRKELALLRQLIHVRNYQAGEYIFHQGEPGVGMYIITRGSVRIASEAERGEMLELAVLGQEDFFGEMALLNEIPRSADAVALEESELIGVFRPDFYDLINKNPEMGLKIMLQLTRIIAERLNRTNETLSQLRGHLSFRIKTI